MRYSTKQAWATGGAVFAATVMLIVGVFQILQGLAAIIQDNFFVVGANYAFDVDTTAWGWIHLGIGVLVTLAGFALFTGAIWARALAIILVSISAIANFFWVPYYPLWALLIIAVDIFLIWAIATAGRSAGMDVDDAAMSRGEMYAGAAGRTSAERWPAANAPGGREWETTREGATSAPPPDEAAQQAAQQAAEEARRQARR